jgi:hypothetical protein|tara:strand:- start:463 stop:654 length:192 start_codon:yes stop_codon:yes gene_type:complete
MNDNNNNNRKEANRKKSSDRTIWNFFHYFTEFDQGEKKISITICKKEDVFKETKKEANKNDSC